MSEQTTCPHNIIYQGICVECNQILNDINRDFNHVRYADDKELTVSPELNDEYNINLENELVSSRKLALILDLDQTVIDTICVNTEQDAENWIAMDESHRDDFLIIRLQKIHLVRFRPGFREFLEKIAPNYMMQIYTLSRRHYAHAIMEMLDPTSKYFRRKLLCADDVETKAHKTIRNFFSYSDRLAVVLDDSPKVWTNENGSLFPGLLEISPFCFFNDQEQSIFPRGLDDITLFRMADLLNDIQHKFYQEETSHVLITITDFKRQVFRDCHIVFSDIYRPDEQKDINYYVTKTESFGGTFHPEFVPYATHVIAGPSISPIVAEALKYKGIFIVNWHWFQDSHHLIQRQDEMKQTFASYNPAVPTVTDGPLPREDPPDISEIDTDGFDHLEAGEEEDGSDMSWADSD